MASVSSYQGFYIDTLLRDESSLDEYFDQLTQELLTSFQQTLKLVDSILYSSFVAWVDPKSNLAMTTCTVKVFRQMQLAFVMMETMRLEGFAPVVRGEDVVRKIFELVSEDSNPQLLRESQWDEFVLSLPSFPYVLDEHALSGSRNAFRAPEYVAL